MSRLKFNHVFAILVGLSILSAFVLTPRYPKIPNQIRSGTQNLFLPVAWPSAYVARRIEGWINPQKPVDDGATAGHIRSLGPVLVENDELRQQIANLTQQLAALKELNRDRETLGDIRPLCKPVSVSGADAGNREAINLSASSLDGLSVGQAVLYSGGLAGRIDRSGPGGAHVRLVTDYGFKTIGLFGRIIQTARGLEFVRIATPNALVEGAGKGAMVVRSLTLKDVSAAGIAEGDWLVLNDPDWPMHLQGRRLGRVASIGRRKDAPLFAEIVIKPAGNLMTLREVMVFNR